MQYKIRSLIRTIYNVGDGYTVYEIITQKYTKPVSIVTKKNLSYVTCDQRAYLHFFFIHNYLI